MNYFDLYSSYPDHIITAAWNSQVKDADKTPWLTDTLTECGGELFLRFAACYAELRTLPRSARRALQRKLACSSELAAILPECLRQGGKQLQHRMAWSLAGAALLLALGQGVATAATITVTTNNPNIISDGQCSLIEAIINANNDAATHVDCPAGSGTDTIVLPANATLSLSNSNAVTYYGQPIGLPLIESRMTIEGNGATIARQGNAPDFGLMAITYFGDLTLQQVTLSGGQTLWGGALYNYGALTIANSTISGNSAFYGGGGVANYETLTIKNSTISGNMAYRGGGVSNFDTVTIESSTVSGNTASDKGGGIFNSGSLAITSSTISGNSANHGADVFNALAIGATTLAKGEAGASFTSDLMISGGVGPYIVSITSGKLPAGLSLGNDGIISGILSSTAKNALFTVNVTDSLNDSIIRNFTITVIKALRVAEKAKTGRLGKNYNAFFKTKGGLGPFNWSITSGALPPGLSFNAATGAITGIPTQTGEFPLTVQVTDALGGIEVENLTLKIK